MASGRLAVILLWLVGAATASHGFFVLDNVLHHAIPPDGPGLREVTYGSQKLVVENTCFYAGNRARIDDERDVKRGLCKYPGSWRDYLEKLGVVGRDTAKHPWGE